MKRLIFSLALILAVAAISATVFAATIYVKPDGTGDQPTIQAGIDAAVGGDVVLLAAGTYTGEGNRDIHFNGKAIRVTSESGRDATIIDCQELGHGFYFINNETASSVLSGVTIRNGASENQGAGIYCNSSPTISDNAIVDCHADIGGGGIYVSGSASSPTISSNMIAGNYAELQGGGIYCTYYACPTITGNTIVENISGGFGGGIQCQSYCFPRISNNTIVGNYAMSGGGICSVSYSAAQIENNVIAFSGSGEGLFCSNAIPTLINCDVFGNAGGDALCGTDGGGNISADPLFCGIPWSGNYYIRSDSPCAPGNHSSGMLIGAWPVGCGVISVEETTWGNIKILFR